MIPILFGICTAVLTMVGVNMGAGQAARARRIAWTGSFVGAGIGGTIGLVIAIFPMLWLQLFSHDPHVLAMGSDLSSVSSLRPTRRSDLGFVIAFAAQGAGHVLWPLSGRRRDSSSPPAAAGSPPSYFGGGMAALASMVSASLVAYAMTCAIAMLSGAVWRTEKA